jgi:hypothetical protein
MAKRRITCPECGHRHFISLFGQAVGVRSKRITGNQFEHSITVPGEMIEGDRYYSISEQMIAAGAVGISAGALLGHMASIPWHVTNIALTAEIISGCALAGLALGCGFVAAERSWQLKERLPYFVRQYKMLANDTPPSDEVTLTVDHRYRDGHTQAGRTINYFGTLPIDIDRFNEYAHCILRDDSLAIAQWTGSGRPFSRNEYDRLLGVLRSAGAVVNVPGKGNQLTGGGRRALRQHLKQEGVDVSD